MNIKRRYLAFSRTGQFVMSGSAALDVPEHMDWDDIIAMAKANDGKEFAEFLPLDLNLSDDEWEFEPVEEDDTEED